MKIIVPDDYQDCVRKLHCFSKLSGHQVGIYNDTVSSLDELTARFAEADAIVMTRERTKFRADLLDRLPKLKILSQTGKVAAHIDVSACTARGIAVLEGTGSGRATAELTWAMILASRRHLLAEANRLRAGVWQGHLGQQLYGQRLGVWSYGKIGRLVAGYGKAFGMKVWVWGRETSLADAQKDGFEIAPSRAAFFEQSDVLSLHIRLNQDTRSIVKASDLARMKATALLINTSRAELIEEGALLNAAKAGRPGFVATDVYEQEPLLGASHPLLGLPNALCTPHLGYVEKDNYELYFGSAFDNILNCAAGKFENLANPEVLSASNRRF